MRENELKEELLVKVFGKKNLPTVKAWIEFDGRCAYCGQDLVEERLHYACGEVDHLIPENILSDNGEALQANLVLACRLCNSLKHYENPCQKGEDCLEMLKNNRNELLQRTREIIAKKAVQPHADWWKVRMILRGAIIKS